jgi:long-subunit acyl-CoA synthetase (AMP-forming)
MPDATLLHAFYRREQSDRDLPFLHQPFGERWETYTWGETGQYARRLANYLLAQGFPPGSNIALISKNCREWIIADLAIMMAGHVSVPLYPTLSGAELGVIIAQGDVRAAFIGKTEVWEDMQQGLPAELPLIRFPHYAGNSRIDRGADWQEIIATYDPLDEPASPDPDDLMTILFTSGTTGTPKGVMIRYGAIQAQVRAIHDANPLSLDYGGDNRFFSFLPLNHIAERGVVEIMCIQHGGQISFTESIDRFLANLQDVRPTLIFAVPRIWNKLQQGIWQKMPERRLRTLLRIPLVGTLIKNKIRKGLGLDRSRCNITGAAPIAQSVKDWFARIGIPLSEAYGMTENCATATMLFPGEDKPGSVGRAHPGTEIRIDPDTQEILTRSEYTMDGYYKAPDITARTIVDGWLHTGDRGYLDDEGYLYITGRVKDTFKTAKGKFIVPRAIEDHFSGLALIDQLCLVGLGLTQPVLLIVPSESGARLPRPELSARLAQHLTTINAELSSYQRIATIVVLSEPFSIPAGTLTPTLKIRRGPVYEQYQSRLEEWVDHAGPVAWS